MGLEQDHYYLLALPEENDSNRPHFIFSADSTERYSRLAKFRDVVQPLAAQDGYVVIIQTVNAIREGGYTEPRVDELLTEYYKWLGSGGKTIAPAKKQKVS